MKDHELTEDQESAIVAAYSSLYDEYKKCNRKRDLYFKNIASEHWKKRCLDFQSVIKDVLKMKVTFKEFKS